MPKTFEDADGVKLIADSLIPNYHPELATARIRYIFESTASKKGGKPVPGKVSKLGGFQEWALELDFVMAVALDVWNTLTEAQRTALIDHLLERCTGTEEESTGEMKWSLREPDVNEFATILHRHGVWNQDLTDFVSVAKRINIDEILSEETDTEVLTQSEN